MPEDDRYYDKTGYASWYGNPFHGRKTANGEIYDMHKVSAAHKTLPLPSYAEVTNLKNYRRIVVRLNDRGPFVSGRLIDLSRRAAQLLGMIKSGVVPVRIRRVYPKDAPEVALAPAPSSTQTSPDFLLDPPVYITFKARASSSDRIMRKLENYGKVWLDPLDGDSIRVAVGPFRKLTNARKALRKIRSRGYKMAKLISHQTQ